ncbi:MAG: hypothetical protein Q8L68_02235 [Methylococcales bacterium]|nr:hypothetical protein [Methylococcales bacterium]
MSARLTLPVQWSLTLLMGLFLGYAFQPAAEVAIPISETPASTEAALTLSPAPFVTLPGGLLVRVNFFRDEAPQFVKIIYLDQARLTVFPHGDDRIEILNANGQVLYSQSFLIEYLEGDPPRPVNSKTVIFVLPSMQGAVEVVITTSNGEVKYDIPSK